LSGLRLAVLRKVLGSAERLERNQFLLQAPPQVFDVLSPRYIRRRDGSVCQD
jgi:hypothetical protein